MQIRKYILTLQDNNQIVMQRILDRYAYYIPSWGAMLRFFLLYLAGIVVGAVLMAISTLAFGEQFSDGYAMIVAYPLQFIFIILYVRKKSRKACSCGETGYRLDNSNFGSLGGPAMVFLVAVATIALVFVNDWLGTLLPPIPSSLKSILEGSLSDSLWVNLLVAAVLAPIVEEWLCRGQVLRGLLCRGVKPVWAILASAAFFAVIHANPWQAVVALTAGAFMGFIYYRTGSLKLTVLVHMINNAGSVICSNIGTLKEAGSFKEVIPVQDYYVIVLLSAAIIIAAVCLTASKVPASTTRGSFDRLDGELEKSETV